MTAEEYALYEKMLTLLSSNPEFALKLLEAMIYEKEPPFARRCSNSPSRLPRNSTTPWLGFIKQEPIAILF